MHSEASDFPQEMLIAFNSTSIVEVSNHQFPESFTILDGSARYFFYKPDGSHLADVVLSPFGTNNSFYCYIPNLLHHRFCPLTKYALAHELAFSHFDPSLTTIFLDSPFDHISGLSNKNLSLVPVSLFSNSFDSRISTGPSFHNVKIYPSKFFSLNTSEFLSLCSPSLPSLVSICPPNSSVLDSFLYLPPNTTFVNTNPIPNKALSVLSGSIILKVKDADCITAAQNSFSSLSSSDFSITNSSSITPSLVRLTLSNS